MKLKKLMSPITICHSPNDTLLSVVQTISQRHYSCALICHYDKPVGILTERDIVRFFASNTLDGSVKVGDVMTKDPICVNADTDLLDALEICESRSLRHLPIVDKTHRLVGVVTQTDLVKAHVTTFENGSKMTDQNRKLHILSVEDPLTGLPNRRAMEIDIKHAAAISQRQSKPYSLAMIDIDFFKLYNDHYGHQAGDDALVFIADLLRSNLRSSDKIFRYGGEEFLFLMPLTPIDGAAIATQRIVDKIAQSRFKHEHCELGVLTVSIGVASSNSTEWERTIEEADSALYDAKLEGRNRISLVEPCEESEFWDFSRKIDRDQPTVN